MMYNKQNPLRVVTLCSGYDSQCLALNRLKCDFPEFNYELVAWSEFDPETPNKPLEQQPAVIAHNALFPQWADRNLGDMTKIDWTQIPDFDLLFYSTPCQSISSAGLQHGFTEGSGTRSSIIWNVRDAVKIKKPKYLCLENVKAMISRKFVGMFNLWQRELEKLGYVNFAEVLNAKDYGVPQNRERIFLLSIRDDGDEPKFSFPKEMKLEKRLKDILETEVDEKYYLSQQVIDSFEAHKERNAAKGNGFGWNPTTGDVAANAILTGSLRPADNFIEEPTIVAMRGREPQVMTPKRTEYGKAIRKQYEAGEVQEQRKNIQQLEPRIDGVSNTLTSVQKDNLVIEPMIYDDYNGRLRDDQDTCGTLTTNCGNEAPRNGFKIIEPINTDEDGNASTITAGYYKYGSKTLLGDTFGTSGTAVKESEYRIRKLTERECFRLMDVPDEYIDKIQQSGVSRSQQYKMAGNSIVVNVLYHIFRKAFIETENENEQLSLF